MNYHPHILNINKDLIEDELKLDKQYTIRLNTYYSGKNFNELKHNGSDDHDSNFIDKIFNNIIGQRLMLRYYNYERPINIKPILKYVNKQLILELEISNIDNYMNYVICNNINIYEKCEYDRVKKILEDEFKIKTDINYIKSKFTDKILIYNKLVNDGLYTILLFNITRTNINRIDNELLKYINKIDKIKANKDIKSLKNIYYDLGELKFDFQFQNTTPLNNNSTFNLCIIR